MSEKIKQIVLFTALLYLKLIRLLVRGHIVVGVWFSCEHAGA